MGKLHEVEIHRLRPTQVTVGLIEVRDKRAQLEALKKKEQRDFMELHPIPAVWGPDGKLYITDHHHLGRAASEADVDTGFFCIEGDFSKCPIAQFWPRMSENDWAHPVDQNGTMWLRGDSRSPREPHRRPLSLARRVRPGCRRLRQDGGRVRGVPVGGFLPAAGQDRTHPGGFHQQRRHCAQTSRISPGGESARIQGAGRGDTRERGTKGLMRPGKRRRTQHATDHTGLGGRTHRLRKRPGSGRSLGARTGAAQGAKPGSSSRRRRHARSRASTPSLREPRVRRFITVSSVTRSPSRRCRSGADRLIEFTHVGNKSGNALRAGYTQQR